MEETVVVAVLLAACLTEIVAGLASTLKFGAGTTTLRDTVRVSAGEVELPDT
jgi:hypothetical protein